MIRFFYNFSILLYIIVFAGCGNDTSRLFTSLDENKTGINFQNTFFDDGPLNVANYIYFYNGGGVAIGDINNDGFLIFFLPATWLRTACI